MHGQASNAFSILGNSTKWWIGTNKEINGIYAHLFRHVSPNFRIMLLFSFFSFYYVLKPLNEKRPKCSISFSH